MRATRIPDAERQTLHELSRLEDFRECDEDSHGVHDDVDLARRTLDEQGRRQRVGILSEGERAVTSTCNPHPAILLFGTRRILAW